MKNHKTLALVSLMVLYTMPTFATVGDGSNAKPVTEETRSTALIERLEEIKSIDKTSITRTEKKTLRKEVKSIKKELKTNSDGIYLSAGAAILIILLLIIIL